MTQPQFNTWQAIQAEVLRRIHARDWPPGHTIPNEIDLAAEFGCARATVNRALQALADTGVLERRRKAGTRVALLPVSRATIEIPLIREEIKAAGKAYEYRLQDRQSVPKVPNWAASLGDEALHIKAVHLADAQPYVAEDRWISTNAVPLAMSQPFDTESPNEWLLSHIPYTHGDISFLAMAAPKDIAETLGCPNDAPLLTIERITWDHDKPLTAVRLYYAPGHRLHTEIGPTIKPS